MLWNMYCFSFNGIYKVEHLAMTLKNISITLLDSGMSQYIGCCLGKKNAINRADVL